MQTTFRLIARNSYKSFWFSSDSHQKANRKSDFPNFKLQQKDDRLLFWGKGQGGLCHCCGGPAVATIPLSIPVLSIVSQSWVCRSLIRNPVTYLKWFLQTFHRERCHIFLNPTHKGAKQANRLASVLSMETVRNLRKKVNSSYYSKKKGEQHPTHYTWGKDKLEKHLH